MRPFVLVDNRHCNIYAVFRSRGHRSPQDVHALCATHLTFSVSGRISCTLRHEELRTCSIQTTVIPYASFQR